MTRGVTEKKFEANVPVTVWREYERWAQGRGRIPNTQLLEAMFRLFLAAPESVKLLALYGRVEQLEAVTDYREDFLAAEILDAAEADEAAPHETTVGKPAEAKRSRPKGHRRTG